MGNDSIDNKLYGLNNQIVFILFKNIIASKDLFLTGWFKEMPGDIFGNVLFDKWKIAPCNSGIKIFQEQFFRSVPAIFFADNFDHNLFLFIAPRMLSLIAQYQISSF